MFVLTVIDGMYELMQKGVQDLNAIAQRWGDKDLIHLVRRGFGTPALPDMATLDVGAGKTTGDVTIGNAVAFGTKKGFECGNGIL